MDLDDTDLSILMFSGIYAEIDKLQIAVDDVMKRSYDIMTDKSLPLEDRWNLYRKAVKSNLLHKNESYGDGHVTILDYNLNPYDDFRIERYERVSYLSLHDGIIQRIHEGTIDRDKLDEWKEEVLASGCSSFTYDW